MPQQKPQQKVYLDDNGEPIQAGAKVYLDDNGEPIGAEKKPEGKSVGGFLTNALTSTGKLLKDTAVGAVDMAKFVADTSPLSFGTPLSRRFERAQQTRDVVRNAPQIGRLVLQGAKDRYGSLENIGNTLYTDPAGAASDLAALLTLGGSAAATKAPKVAGMLRKAESVINPLRVVEPAAKAIEYGTAGAIRPMLAPPTSAIRQQRAPLEIERTALREGAVTEGAAGRKLGAATARTTQAADEATKAGVTIPRERVTQLPKTLDDVERVTPNVRELDDLAALESEATASLPQKMTPSQLLERRRAQDRDVDKAYRAEERGGYIRSTRDKGKKEIAGNMRMALREAAPAVVESDDAARKLGLVRTALENANTRPKSIPMGGALLGMGGGAVAGGPAGAAVGAAFGTGRLFPQIPLALGSVPVRGSAAAGAMTANPVSRQGLLLAALLERLAGDQ